jgi:two-component system NarL family response regulator
MEKTALNEILTIFPGNMYTSPAGYKDIRLMLVDDHQVVREGLRRMLEIEDGLQVVGEACNGEEAIIKAAQLLPDVIVMDLKMPGMDGITATHEIKKILPNIKVLILTLYAEDYVKQAIEAGASGYLLKDSDTDQITKAIRQVNDGYCPIAPSLTRDLVVEFAQISRSGRTSLLTKRQIEILKLIADGLNSKEISNELYISTSTVKREIRQILNRLEVSDRAQAVSEAMKKNII